MKIIDVRVHPVAFPDPPLRNSWGVHAPYAIRTIIELETEEGLIGVGETYGGETMRQLCEDAGKAILGLDAQQMRAIAGHIPNRRVYSAIEVACLDVIGQGAGRKICDLLGGRARDSVPFSGYLFFKYENDEMHGNFVPGKVMCPDSMLEEARAFVKLGGFTSLKIKGGVLDPDEEVECLRLFEKEFGSGIGHRLDPNCIWPLEKAIDIAHQLEDMQTEYMEDPVHGLEQMAELKKHTHLLMGTNSCVVRFDQVPESVRRQSVDVILSDHHFWGGLYDNLFLSHLCQVFGLGISMHSNSHLGISMAAMIHSAATFFKIDYACDTHYPWLVEDIIVGGKLSFQDGHMAVPNGFGLGVALDQDKLKEFTENYIRFGTAERDDLGELKRRDPDWQTRMPEWMMQIDPSKYV